ncbi:MAG: type II secretion system protein [Armatimonadota bacterium]
MTRGTVRTSKRRRGVTLAEVVIAAMILGFLLAATANLYQVGFRQQRLAGAYGQVQTDLRDALRRATRGMRHGFRVVSPSTSPSFPVTTSSAAQVIVEVPEPSASASSSVEVRFHVSGGVLYAQRSDQAAPGLALIQGVQTVSFEYFRQPSSGTEHTPVNGAPASANEVRVTVTARRPPATTTVSTLVNLRNSIAGYL